MSCGQTAPVQDELSCGPTRATVTEVLDGDTVRISSGDTIRLLLVDTPETGSNAECLGFEVADFVRQSLQDVSVDLAYSEACRDRYDRLLAYIGVEGRDFNRHLVERGYACVLHISPAGDERAADYELAQTAAATDGRGIWGSCDPVPCR